MSGIDIAQLAAAVRHATPRADAALLVGSAVRPRGVPANDLDVLVFGADEREAIVIAAHFDGRRLEIVLSSLERLCAPLAQGPEALSQLRHIRKFLDGVVIFDDRRKIAGSRAELHARRVPRAALRAPIAAAMRPAEQTSDVMRDRLAFLHRVENMVFAWLHLDLRTPYSKPKWIWFDVMSTPELEGLRPLMRIMSEEARDRCDPEAWASHEEAALPGVDPIHLEDARALARDGHVEAAVWPLRMAAYQIASAWARKHGLGYRDLRDIADVVPAVENRHPELARLLVGTLLLNRRLPPALDAVWDVARGRFAYAVACAPHRGARLT